MGTKHWGNQSSKLGVSGHWETHRWASVMCNRDTYWEDKQTARGSRGWDVSIPEQGGWWPNNSNTFEQLHIDWNIRAKTTSKTIAVLHLSKDLQRHWSTIMEREWVPRPRSSFSFVFIIGPQNHPESLTDSELNSGRDFQYTFVQEIKSMAGLWGKRGDRQKCSSGSGRKENDFRYTN